MLKLNLTKIERILIHDFIDGQQGNITVLRRAIRCQEAVNVDAFNKSALLTDLEAEEIEFKQEDLSWLLTTLQDCGVLSARFSKQIVALLDKLEASLAPKVQK